VLGDEPQRLDVVEVGREQPPGDGGRGVQPLAAGVRRLVQARVLDHCCRGGGECACELFVVRVERSAGALGQVQVAEGLVADPHRHPQEAGHRRVTRREAAGPWVVRDPRQPDGFGVLDQGAQQALALG
jgi:hypothetical protein